MKKNCNFYLHLTDELLVLLWFRLVILVLLSVILLADANGRLDKEYVRTVESPWRS